MKGLSVYPAFHHRKQPNSKWCSPFSGWSLYESRVTPPTPGPPLLITCWAQAHTIFSMKTDKISLKIKHSAMLFIFHWMLFLHSQLFFLRGSVFFWDDVRWVEISLQVISVFYSASNTSVCNMYYTGHWFNWVCVAGMQGGVVTSVYPPLVLVSAERKTAKILILITMKRMCLTRNWGNMLFTGLEK